jgi:hypothetical protein
MAKRRSPISATITVTACAETSVRSDVLNVKKLSVTVFVATSAVSVTVCVIGAVPVIVRAGSEKLSVVNPGTVISAVVVPVPESSRVLVPTEVCPTPSLGVGRVDANGSIEAVDVVTPPPT